MVTAHLDVLIIWGSLFIVLTCVYMGSALYIYRRREYQELFAKSPGILLVSLWLNFVQTLTSMSLGFLYILGIERESTIAFPISLLYCLSRHALYISTILKIYRLLLLNNVRWGNINHYDSFLKQKERLSDNWNLKVMLIYTSLISSVFIAFFCVQYAYNVKGALDEKYDRTLDFYYNLMWTLDTISELICYFIYYCKLYKVNNVGLVKTELILYILIWSLGIVMPFVSYLDFYIIIVPIRNLLTILVTIIITNYQCKNNSIIPLPNIKDSRMITEDEKIFDTFNTFVTKSKNTLWIYYLNLLMAISIFKIDNTRERANHIYVHLIQNQNILSIHTTRRIDNFMRLTNHDTFVDVHLFYEIEEHILCQFDEYVYPEYCRSSGYIRLNKEMDDYIFV